MKAALGFIRRFGFWRGLEFCRVAAKCDKNHDLCATWAAHYRAKGSRLMRHEQEREAKVYLAFAEMLQSSYDTLVLNRKPRRPILTNHHRRIERTIQRGLAKKRRRP